MYRFTALAYSSYTVFLFHVNSREISPSTTFWTQAVATAFVPNSLDCYPRKGQHPYWSWSSSSVFRSIGFYSLVLQRRKETQLSYRFTGFLQLTAFPWKKKTLHYILPVVARGVADLYILNEDTQPVIRAIEVSHTACKYAFRQNIRSHSWSVF